MMAHLHRSQAAYRTSRHCGADSKGSSTGRFFWDRRSVITTSETAGRRRSAKLDYDILIVGGEDHKTGQAIDTAERFVRLEQWTRERFPMIERVEYRWSGQVVEPVDYMAYIGKNPGGDEHIYVATGDSGNGMTHGTIAGIILNDCFRAGSISGKSYDPSRVKFGRPQRT